MLSRCHSCLSTAVINAVCTRHAVLGLASQHLISIDAKGADSVGPSFARGDMVLNWQVDGIVDRHSCFHCHMPSLFHMPVANLTGSPSDQGLRNRNCVPDRLCMLGIDLKVGYVTLCNLKLSATTLAHAARGCVSVCSCSLKERFDWLRFSVKASMTFSHHSADRLVTLQLVRSRLLCLLSGCCPVQLCMLCPSDRQHRQ